MECSTTIDLPSEGRAPTPKWIQNKSNMRGIVFFMVDDSKRYKHQ
ncbi:hypothetical protein M092_4288 [Parabacteroides distasonis str. 3776 D15 iv]|uniref:Uncharacterized protein n=1 Tax=Parabacteroides distasonis str. 3776 D15 i TaxID=1339342 RepID=A0AB34L6V0_PARDI|nr:hypothetical protein M091_1001 [Parabacteroides distasonis str. 3776 D15 i]KDS67004.1 hypothetical protein M092_4288 [Parabacteroides distasonis str. 3776 D15 iv]